MQRAKKNPDYRAYRARDFKIYLKPIEHSQLLRISPKNVYDIRNWLELN